MRLIRVLGVFVCALFTTLLAVSPAAADDYPTAIIGRPLALEPSTMQPSIAAAFIHNSAGTMSSNAETVTFGADYGVRSHLQVGAVLDLQVSPSTDFARGLVSGQYQFLAFAALRLDIGAERIGNGDLTFAFGVGLPIRLKLMDKIALISGRPYAYGAEDDLFTVHTGSGTTTDLRAPLGILYQLDEHVALVGRSGIRKLEDAYFVPLGADVTVTVSRLDFGLTLDLSGQVSPEGSGFADLFTVRGFAQFRLW